MLQTLLSAVERTASTEIGVESILTLTITKAQLNEMGITTECDLKVTGYCCHCHCDGVYFLHVPAFTIGEKTAEPKGNGCIEYGKLEEFPYEKGTQDFVQEVERMLSELKT